MITASVMTVLLTALVSQIATLHNSQRSSDDSERLADIVHMLHEKIVAVDYDRLGTDPWTLERPYGSDIWMGEASSLPDERQLQRLPDRTTLGLLSQPSGLKDLRVYLEYYLARDTEIYGVPYDGLLDENIEQFSDYTPEVLERCRLRVSIADLAGAPVILRLSVGHEDRMWHMFIARRSL